MSERVAHSHKERPPEKDHGMVLMGIVILLLYPFFFLLDLTRIEDIALTSRQLWVCASIRFAVTLALLKFLAYASCADPGDRPTQASIDKWGGVIQVVVGLSVISIALYLRTLQDYFSGLVMLFILITTLSGCPPLHIKVKLLSLTAAFLVAIYAQEQWLMPAEESWQPRVFNAILFLTASAGFCAYGYEYLHFMRTRRQPPAYINTLAGAAPGIGSIWKAIQKSSILKQVFCMVIAGLLLTFIQNSISEAKENAPSQEESGASEEAKQSEQAE